MSNENVPANPAETPEVVAAVQETNRLKAIKANVEQWRSALQESARVAVDALSKEAPIVGQHELPLEERSKILGEAIHQIRELVRPRPGTVAFLEEHSWYHVKEQGVYKTPQAAIDAVTSNPKMPTAGEIDGAVPHMKFDPPAEKPFTTASLASIPELNIEFQQYHTKDYYKFLCWWHNEHEPAGRVYELTVKPGDAGDFWYANALAGGKPLFSLGSYSKRLAIECGLVAMRRYLIRGHRAAWTTWRKAEAARKAESEVAS